MGEQISVSLVPVLYVFRSPTTDITVWCLSLQAKLPDIGQRHCIPHCVALRSENPAVLRRTSFKDLAVVINWKVSTPDAYVASCVCSEDNFNVRIFLEGDLCCSTDYTLSKLEPKWVRLLLNGRILLWSKRLLTIHALPKFSTGGTLKGLTSSEVDTLWSLDIPSGYAVLPSDDTRGYGIYPAINFWAFEDLSTLASAVDITRIICIMAPTFWYTFRVPLSDTSPLQINSASCYRSMFEYGADVALHRGIVKTKPSGATSLVGHLDNWIEVDGETATLRGFSAFDYSITGRAKPERTTGITFYEGSGRVCVSSCYTSEIEILDFV